MLKIRIVLSPQFRVTIFSTHIVYIILVSTEEEVGGINATLLIASM